MKYRLHLSQEQNTLTPSRTQHATTLTLSLFIMAEDAEQSLDVYATPFVPQYLKDVNRVPAITIPSQAARWINFEAYVQTFAGNDFLPRSSHGDGAPRQARKEGIALNELCEINYQDYFLNLLDAELASLRAECDSHALYSVPVTEAQRDPRPWMFWLHVPGLRESNLRIETGDTVLLRQLSLNAYGMPNTAVRITHSYGQPIDSAVARQIQNNAVVWNVDRNRELLALRVDGLQRSSMIFNVQFAVQSGRLGALHRAVTTVHEGLSSESEGWLRAMLFSHPTDGTKQTSLGYGRFPIKVIDPLLNFHQVKAINTVVNEEYGPVPFLISGPPGTGKTKTMVELALQLLKDDPAAHLLVVAPSDPAADTLLQRLSAHLRPRDVQRLNSPARNFAEVPGNVLSFCCIDQDMFTLPSFEQLMRLKIVVTACRDVEILLRACVSNKDIALLEHKLAATMHPTLPAPPLRGLHWTGLLMDEAAQATEPEALLSLALIAPPSEAKHLKQPIVVMAGDQNQLGPRTASKIPGLQTSLFERLFNRPLYRDHPMSRSKYRGGMLPRLTQSMLPIIRPPFANLIQNYRSHAAVLATPSTLFYNDTLEPEACNTDTLMPWSGWRGRKWPVLFAVNTGSDEVEGDGGGWYNNLEARKALDYARSFLDAHLIHPAEICIMSPFAAQVKLLRHRARQIGLWEINIGPLEAFQGLESRLIILCTTRTRDRFLDQDAARGLGVIHEPKRFNVAVTRAREGLIMLGHPDILAKDQEWRALMSFCHRNGLWQDEEGTIKDGKSQRAGNKYATEWQKEDVRISRLERQLMQQEELEHQHGALANGVRKLGIADDDETEFWRDGVETEQAFRKHAEHEDADLGWEEGGAEFSASP